MGGLRLVLGQIPFLVYINDIDEALDMSEAISKFPDDTKVGRIVESDMDQRGGYRRR